MDHHKEIYFKLKNHAFFGGIFLLFLFCYGSIFPLRSIAEPLLFDPLTIEGITIYRDHLDKHVFYHAPGKLLLKKNAGLPVFRFSLIGYLGSAKTQDQGIFMDKGIITFTVREDLSAEKIERIKYSLRKEQHPSALLKRLPIKGMTASLIYEEVSEKGSLQKGSLTALSPEKSQDEMKDASPTSELWRERSFLIALKDLDCNFFWNAFQSGQLMLSLSYVYTVDGKDEAEGVQISTTHEISGALPIRISPKQYPELFQKIDLGGKMKVGYTHLDIYCFDFVNRLAPDLYAKVVEIRYEDLKGAPMVSHVEFNEKDLTYKHSIDFHYAKKINSAYDYRIILIRKNGETKPTNWIQDNNDSLLDVTAYKNVKKFEPEQKVNRRGLY